MSTTTTPVGPAAPEFLIPFDELVADRPARVSAYVSAVKEAASAAVDLAAAVLWSVAVLAVFAVGVAWVVRSGVDPLLVVALGAGPFTFAVTAPAAFDGRQSLLRYH